MWGDTCKTCAFWKQNANKLEDGECRKNPPVPVYAEGMIRHMSPKTTADFWCGEHWDIDQANKTMAVIREEE